MRVAPLVLAVVEIAPTSCPWNVAVEALAGEAVIVEISPVAELLEVRVDVVLNLAPVDAAVLAVAATSKVEVGTATPIPILLLVVSAMNRFDVPEAFWIWKAVVELAVLLKVARPSMTRSEFLKSVMVAAVSSWTPSI